jgi:hypothetical protein
MCSGDAFRLCSSEISDVARIMARMLTQRANPGGGCRAVMDRARQAKVAGGNPGLALRIPNRLSAVQNALRRRFARIRTR